MWPTWREIPTARSAENGGEAQEAALHDPPALKAGTFSRRMAPRNCVFAGSAVEFGQTSWLQYKLSFVLEAEIIQFV